MPRPAFGVLTYTPASGAVLTAGSQTLSVTLVFRPTPLITPTSPRLVHLGSWSGDPDHHPGLKAPAGITYGTALSATHELNATASVLGVLTCHSPHPVSVPHGRQPDAVRNAPARSDRHHGLHQCHQDRDLGSWSGDPDHHLAELQQPSPMRTCPGSDSARCHGFDHWCLCVYPGCRWCHLRCRYSDLVGEVHSCHDTTDFTTVTVTTTLVVNKAATPVITWAAPAAITFGTALSVTQLDASSAWFRVS